MQDDLEARLDRLERENRWLKRGGILALAVVAGVIVMGQAQGPKVLDEVKTRKLTVVDEAGNIRADLSVIKGGPALRLMGKTEKPQASLLIDGVNTGLLIAASEAGGFATFTVSKTGSALLLHEGCTDSSGTPQALLSVDCHGPELSFRDKAGHKRVAMSTIDFRPMINILDDQEKNIWVAP